MKSSDIHIINSVVCPKCGAVPMEPCKTQSGSDASTHKDRRAAYESVFDPDAERTLPLPPRPGSIPGFTLPSYNALWKFATEVSRMTHEDQPDDDGNKFEMTSEDAIATVNSLIMEARQLTGTDSKCVLCEESVPYIIGCPDGREICQACFDAGQG